MKGFEIMGNFFGYPKCCIKFFIKRFEGFRELTVKQEEVHGNRGFIPCQKCAEKITKDTIEKLIKKRVCSEPFPFENEKQLDEYLNKYKKHEPITISR